MSSQTPKPQSSVQTNAHATVEAHLTALDDAVTTVAGWADKAQSCTKPHGAQKGFLKGICEGLAPVVRMIRRHCLGDWLFQVTVEHAKNDIRHDIIATEEKKGVVSKMDAALAALSANCMLDNSRSPMLKRPATGEPRMELPHPSMAFSGNASFPAGSKEPYGTSGEASRL
jgi:hypothetical protein